MAVKKRRKDISLLEASRTLGVVPCLTQSILGAALACPMRGRLVLNRWTSPAKAAKTRFGSLFHGLLEYAYSQERPPTAPEAAKRLEETLETLRPEYGAKATEIMQRDMCVALTIWCVYAQHYAEDWIRMGKGQTETEFNFTAHDVIWRGKRDGILPDKHGGLWLFEHKTHAQIDDEWFAQHLSIDLQVLMYLLSLRHTHPGQKVLGVKYNVVRNPGLKFDGLSMQAIRDKLRAHIDQDRAHYFHRFEVRVQPGEIDRFDLELEQMAQYVQHLPAFRNSCACRAPYPCEFLQACSSGSMAGYVQRKELMPELS